MLSVALSVAAFAMLAGVVIQLTNKYRPTNAAGWAVIMIGFGLLTLLKVNVTTGKWVGYSIVVSAGLGLIVSLPRLPGDHRKI